MGYFSGQAPKPKKFQAPFSFSYRSTPSPIPGDHFLVSLQTPIKHTVWASSSFIVTTEWEEHLKLLINSRWRARKFSKRLFRWTGPRKFTCPEMQVELDKIGRFHEITSNWVNVQGFTILDNFGADWAWWNYGELHERSNSCRAVILPSDTLPLRWSPWALKIFDGTPPEVQTCLLNVWLSPNWFT